MRNYDQLGGVVVLVVLPIKSRSFVSTFIVNGLKLRNGLTSLLNILSSGER